MKTEALYSSFRPKVTGKVADYISERAVRLSEIRTMFGAARFQQVCDSICDRLARDEGDRQAFEMLHSSEFTFSCALLGLDGEEAARRISRIAAERRAKLLTRG